MSDLKRLASAASGVLQVLGYSVDAVNKFKQGRLGDSFVSAGHALQMASTRWRDIDYAFNQLSDAADRVFSAIPMPSSPALLPNPARELGFFTGRWSAGNTTVLITHYPQSNALSLYYPSPTTGTNVYTGGIDWEREVLVFTGYNGRSQPLLVVGIPDYDGHNIAVDAWTRDASNELTHLDGFVLSRMR